MGRILRSPVSICKLVRHCQIWFPKHVSSSYIRSFTSNNPGVMYNQDVLVSALRALRTSKSKKRPPSTPGDTQTPQSNESTLQDDLLSLQTQREALSRRHAAEMGAIDAQVNQLFNILSYPFCFPRQGLCHHLAFDLVSITDALGYWCRWKRQQWRWQQQQQQ